MSNEVCTKCGTPLPPNTRFCTKCGAPRQSASAPAPQICRKCGKTVPAGMRFCPGCGTAVNAPGAAAAGGLKITGSAQQQSGAPARPASDPAAQNGGLKVTMHNAPNAAPNQRPMAQQGQTAPNQRPMAQQGQAAPNQRPMAQQGQTAPNQRPMAQQGQTAPNQRPMAQQVQAPQAAAQAGAARPSVCPTCGSIVPEGRNFCTSCGARVGSGPVAAYPRPQAAEPEQTEEEPPKKKHTLLVIGIIVAVLLTALTVLGVVFKDQIQDFLHRGDDKETSAQADDGEDPTGSNQSSTPSTTVPPENDDQISEEEARQKVYDLYPDKEFSLRTLTQSAAGEYYKFEVLDKDNTHIGEIWVNKTDGSIPDHTINWPNPYTSNVHSVDSTEVASIMRNKASGATYSFAVIDMNDGSMAGSTNVDDPMSSSVLIGIPIMYVVDKEIEEGRLSLDDEIPVIATQGSRGSLYGYDRMTVRDLLQHMLRDSSGDAINSLMDYIGRDRINQICHDNGFASVQLVAHIGQTEDYSATKDNYVSSGDLAQILYLLYTSDAGSGRINKNFLEQYYGIQGNLSNNGLGKNLRGSVRSFNGVKAKKFNELILVDNGDGQVYAIAMMAYGAEYDKVLLPAYTEVGDYVDGVMRD